MIRIGLCLSVCLWLFSFNAVEAAEIFFKNGDRLTGEILSETPEFYTVESVVAGRISVDRNEVERLILEPQPEEEEIKPDLWDIKIKGGFDRQRGNTKTTELQGGFLIHRKVEKENEFHLQGDAFYGAENRKMNAQRYSGMTRYAFSFGSSRKWYNFYKLEADHDRFANIQYRFVPSTGLGYWLSDAEAWKLMGELGVGTSHTHYRMGKDDEHELVLIPRAYGDIRFLRESRFYQEIIFYPSITDWGQYRLHLDTGLKNPLSEMVALVFSWVNDYNSDPGPGVKKHDMRLTSSLEVTF